MKVKSKAIIAIGIMDGMNKIRRKTEPSRWPSLYRKAARNTPSSTAPAVEAIARKTELYRLFQRRSSLKACLKFSIPIHSATLNPFHFWNDKIRFQKNGIKLAYRRKMTAGTRKSIPVQGILVL